MKKITLQLLTLFVLGSMLLGACGSPATAPATTAPVTAAPATVAPATAAPATAAPATAAPTAAVPSCGTDPVVMNAYVETGFQIPFSLFEEFTKQFPNVTWNTQQDQFANLINSTPRLLSSDNPPEVGS